MARESAILRLVPNEPDQGVGEEERPSLEHAFLTYGSYVAQIGRRLLGPGPEIEDFVQDVFLDARRGFASVRSADKVKGWIAAIAVRTAYRKLRRRRFRRLFWTKSEVDYSEVPGPGSSPEDAALLKRIYKILDTLPPAQRIAWSLHVLHGERQDDIAELCGCSTRTVKRRLAAARAAIHEVFGDG